MWEKLNPVDANGQSSMHSAHTTASLTYALGWVEVSPNPQAPSVEDITASAMMKSLEIPFISLPSSICNALLIKPLLMTSWGLSLSCKSEEGPVWEQLLIPAPLLDTDLKGHLPIEFCSLPSVWLRDSHLKNTLIWIFLFPEYLLTVLSSPESIFIINYFEITLSVDLLGEAHLGSKFCFVLS